MLLSFSVKKMTKVQAVREFKLYHLPLIQNESVTTRRCAWNDYTSMLLEDGRITESQEQNWTQPRCVLR